mgnify:CR=1 FL=1
MNPGYFILAVPVISTIMGAASLYLRCREVTTYENILIDTVRASDWRFASVTRQNVQSSSLTLLEEVEKQNISFDKKEVLRKQLSEYDSVSSQVAYLNRIFDKAYGRA